MILEVGFVWVDCFMLGWFVEFLVNIFLDFSGNIESDNSKVNIFFIYIVGGW